MASGAFGALRRYTVGTQDTGSEFESRQEPLPRHIAIIMDGNGRWAQQRNLPRHAGHRAGVKSVRMAVEQCARRGIEVLTLFAFSSENWARPRQEVNQLMDLFMNALRGEIKRLQKNRVRLRIIGERSAFSDKLQKRILDAEQATADNDGLLLQIAANYGGRWDITQAARKLVGLARSGMLQPEDITEQTLAAKLSFTDTPDPDLFIRTGGEQRISNFLLWQIAYSELYFTDRLWPDFDEDEFERALVDFSQRQRRFGKTGEQVTPNPAQSG
jgi:undecaprenyl diphosphate synthase